MEITLRVPVKTYVKKYFSVFGLSKIDRTVMRSMLERNFKRFDYRLNKDIYPEILEIKITQDEYERYGTHLAPTALSMFQYYLEDRVKDLFETELMANFRRSQRENTPFNMNEMIHHLRDFFELTEQDLPFETIKKHLDRYKKSEGVNYQAIKIYGTPVPKSRHTCPRKSA